MSADEENRTESSAARILVGLIAAAAIIAVTLWLLSFLGSRRDGGSFGFAAWPLES